MDNSEERHLFTKGNKDKITKRCDCVRTLHIFCPLDDEGMQRFHTNLLKMLKDYVWGSDDFFREVPVIDVFSCFMYTVDECKEMNTNNLYSFWGVVQSFKNLKYMNIQFTDDPVVLEAYEYVRGQDKTNSFDMVQHIYRIDMLEFVLNDMFTHDIIDIINQVLIYDEILPNTYFGRMFVLDFKFDEWVSYMNMFCENNSEKLCQMDTDIIDYLLMFPKIVTMHKPIIRMITDYKDV